MLGHVTTVADPVTAIKHRVTESHLLVEGEWKHFTELPKQHVQNHPQPVNMEHSKSPFEWVVQELLHLKNLIIL